MQHRQHRPWTRRKTADAVPSDPAPGDVFRELQRRRLGDLEDCRLAWERCGDPFALVVALMMSELPEWLSDALLLIVADDVGDQGRPAINLRQRWRRRSNDAVDALRAMQTAAFRAHPQLPLTWENSYWNASRLIHSKIADSPAVTEAAMKKSYERVRKGLRNPGRYFAAKGVEPRLDLALERYIRTVESAIAAQKSR